MKKIVTLTALGAILAATNANAAGFHLREQSAAALGNAFAGATAGAENNSYAYFNVAGLTRQKGTQVNVGGTYIIPRAEAHDIYDQAGNRGQDVNNIVHAAISPNGTISHQLNDEVTLGLALNVPFGMITKYDGEWKGSDHGITSKVITATTTPMVAWKATDKLSVGAGLPIQYIKARLSNTVNGVPLGGEVYGANLEGDTVDVGYQLGAMYEFDENTRIGVGYRSEINHKLKGDISSDAPARFGFLNQDISARLDTPAMFSVGAYHRINDKWEVMAEYQRVFWNSFDSLDIYGTDGIPRPGGTVLISSTPENWRDTNFYAIGVSYQLDHQWKLRLGFAYDESAVKTADRTPRIPDSDRYWYSMGLNYAYSENMTFDFGFTYIKAKDASINIRDGYPSSTSRGVSAEYDNSVKMVGLSLNYKF